MDPKVQQFLLFFKNNAFTAYFGLKFLLKIMFLIYCKVCWCVCRWYPFPPAMPCSVYHYTILQ